VADPHETLWYEVPHDHAIRQGDIFVGLRVHRASKPIAEKRTLIGSAAGENIEVEIVEGNWIVIDASCDVDHAEGRPPNCSYVLVTSAVPADSTTLRVEGKLLNERLEVIRQGGYRGKFLLSGFSEIKPVFPVSYVEFRNHLTTPHAHLLAHLDKRRLRIRSPWREAFGNWVGSCISRVGPEDHANIPKFVKALHDAQRIRAVDE
jgi:hypothetical protein